LWITDFWRDQPSVEIYSRFASRKQPEQSASNSQRDHQEDDSAAMMKVPVQVSGVNTRCQPDNHKNPQGILRD
jgi:hypothetical protein